MAKESRNKYLIKNTAIFAIGNMGTRLINFIMVPLYTYVLTTEQYGDINTITSICSIMIPLIMCNIGEAVRRYLLDENADRYGIQATELIWFCFGVVMSAVIYAVFRLIPGYRTYALEMSLYVLSNAFVSTAIEYLRGKEQLTLYTACGLFQTFLVAALNILFLVKMHLGSRGYLWSYIIAYVVSGVLAFLAGGQPADMKKLKFDKKLFAEMSKFSLMLVPNSLIWWITTGSDKVMITYMISAGASGIYAISSKLPTLLSTLNTILMQAWQHSAIRESESEDKVEYNNQMFRLYTSTLSIVSAGLLLINRPFMNIYVSPAFREAWRYSPFLIVSSLLSTLATFVGTSYYVEKDMKGNLCSAAVGAVVNLSLNLVLIPTIGVTGAAAATCFSYLAVLIYRIYDTKKYLPLKTVTPYTMKLSAVVLYMLAVSFVESRISYVLLGIGMLLILLITKDYYLGMLKKLIEKRKGGR